MCTLGRRLLKDVATENCTKSWLRDNVFCNKSTGICDEYFEKNDVNVINGIRGLASGVFLGT